MTCISGPPWMPGKIAEFTFLAISSSFGQDHAAAGAAQRLVRGRGRDMGVREGRGVEPGRDEAREMGHVDQQEGADAVGDLAHPGEVDDPRDRRAAGDEHLRLVLGRERRDLVVVDQAVLLAHAVLDRVEPLAGLVRLGAVGQVAAGVEALAQDRVAGLQQRLEHALVGLAAGVRLDVGEAAAEELFGAVDGELLGDVDPLAAAVVAPARDSLRRTCWSSPSPAPRARRGETMFSEAISSISLRWRPSSPSMARAISGSRVARVSVKKPGVAAGGVHRPAPRRWRWHLLAWVSGGARAKRQSDRLGGSLRRPARPCGPERALPFGAALGRSWPGRAGRGGPGRR